jgi:lipoprotein NlpI
VFLYTYKICLFTRCQKSFKRQEVRAQALAKEGKFKSSKKKENFENIPKISQDKWDTALIELHLFADCSHRLVEKPQALGTFIRQFSKAVAEVPFKLAKYFITVQKVLTSSKQYP